jgi:hypothetical protein
VESITETLGDALGQEAKEWVRRANRLPDKHANTVAHLFMHVLRDEPYVDFIEVTPTAIESGMTCRNWSANEALLDQLGLLMDIKATQGLPGLGMLLGKIQSGKTRAFMGSIALAFDNGVDVAVIFTKGTLLLAEQTLSRINNDYETFISANELVAQDIRALKDELTHFERNMKRVIVCMKEDDNVKKLINFLSDP